MSTAEQEQNASDISRDILRLSRNSLIVNFRFLSRALSRLEFTSTDIIGFGCDGRTVYYEPWIVIGIYKSTPSEVTRNLLHSMLHCIFRHFLIGEKIDRIRWDLACDIAVEDVIENMKSQVVYAGRSIEQHNTLMTLKEHIPVFTAESIYKWLCSNDFSDEELENEREHFYGDNHGLWYDPQYSDDATSSGEKLREEWNDIAKKIQTELETLDSGRNGALAQALRKVNRSRQNYSEFLKRFGIHAEVMKLSEEEFDNNFYTYGIEIYGNIPLIEPLEYSEEKRIRSFVIAIDTSDSVSGDIVQAFIQHTYNILKQQDTFTSRVLIHIIQCDNEIRDDTVIHNSDQLELYIQNMEILGLGTTDFRPVFTYVDRLIQNRDLPELQGLIYFTDGDGPFPEQAPPYDTAFIIHERDDGFEPLIPGWAVQLSVNEEEIVNGSRSL